MAEVHTDSGLQAVVASGVIADPSASSNTFPSPLTMPRSQEEHQRGRRVGRCAAPRPRGQRVPLGWGIPPLRGAGREGA